MLKNVKKCVLKHIISYAHSFVKKDIMISNWWLYFEGSIKQIIWEKCICSSTEKHTAAMTVQTIRAQRSSSKSFWNSFL